MSLEQRVKILERDANNTADGIERLRAEMNQRFDEVEVRLDRLEQRFDRLENDVRQILELLQQR